MRISGYILVGACLLALAGCGGSTGKVLGLEKEAPDEFAVVSRAPLTLPPDFSLRPPRPGEKRAEEDVRATAEQAVFGNKRRRNTQDDTGDFDGGERALLAKAEALQADTGIRQVIDQENATMAVADDTFVNDLLFWQTEEPAGTIVDADAETKRLQENAGLGRSVTDGDTPMIRREGEKGLLEDFDWSF